MKTALRNLKGVLVLATALVSISLPAAAAQAKKIATVEIPANTQLYATDPQPLSPTQCGQCHNGVYWNLKNDGARHRFACQECHASFHAYSPKKGNWDGIMPKCGSCHPEVHGPQATDCLTCHANPHAPKKVEMGPRLLNTCTQCHPGPKEDLVAYPSKHSKLECQFCHSAHGFKPACTNCHKPHAEGAEGAACAKCHSVHRPLKVTYPKDLPSADCGWCHTKVYDTWSKSASRHGKVACVTCHAERHRFKPVCTDCHKAPHNKEILSRFPNCLGCHLDVHDPPAKKGKAKP